MRVKRTAALAVLLFLPALTLIGWYIYEQLPTWQIPAWIQPGAGDAARGSCAALATMRTYGATFAGDSTAISAADARARAEALVSAQTDLPPGQYVDPRGPALVRAVFPGVGPTLAWLNVAALDDPRTDAAARLGKDAVIYLDAQTGDPLAFVVAAGVDDPLIACGGGPVSRRELARKYAPLIALAGYIGLVTVGLLVASRLRRRVARPRIS